MSQSENDFYRNEDIKNINNTLARGMGIDSGAAGRRARTMGDILTGKRTEGVELDNRGKKGTLDALGQVLATMMRPGFEKQRYQANLALDGKAGDYARSRTLDTLRPNLVKKGEFQTAQEGRKVDTANMVNELQKMLMGNKKNDPRTFETGDAWLKERATNEDQLSRESFEDTAAKLIAIGGGQRSKNSDLSGEYGQRSSEDASNLKQEEIRYKKEQANSVEELSKERKKKYTKEIEEISNDILLKTEFKKAQIKEINNRILNEVAELDQKNLSAKGKRLTETERKKLIKEKLLTEAQNLKKATEDAKTSKTKRQLAEQTMQPTINIITDKAQNQREVNKNTLASGRLTDQKIMNALIKMKSPSDKKRDRDLKEEQIAKTIRTSRGKSGTGDGDGKMILNPDGTVSPPNAGTGASGGVIEMLKTILSGGGPPSGPPTVKTPVSAPSPAQNGKQILASLQDSNTAGWDANQINAFITKVVAQSGGKVNREQAMKILKISQQGN